MCSQEWYREKEMPFGYGQLSASRVPTGYWANYKKYWGAPQPPASQALEAGLSGYVAEAAVPRFVSKIGSLNRDRNWAAGDENGDFMVDTNDYRNLYVRVDRTKDRDTQFPLAGIRYSTNEMVFSNPCE